MRIPILSTLIVLSSIIYSDVFAQDFCGTAMTAQYEKFLRNKDRAHLSNPGSKTRTTLYAPIQYHIIGDDDGNGYFSLDELVSLHCELNASYVGADIEFYLYDHVIYHNNDEYYTFLNTWGGNGMINQHNVPDVINVYITEDPGGVCGYAFYPGSGPAGGAIVLNKSCSSYFSTTLSHEMGHYLGLPHTFDAIGGVEFVDGTNCATKHECHNHVHV